MDPLSVIQQIIHEADNASDFPWTSWLWLDRHSRFRPHATAWYEWHQDRWIPIDWAHLHRLVIDFSRQLGKLQLPAGSRILSCMPNSLTWVALELACAKLELVHVPVEARTSSQAFMECYRAIQPSLVIWNDDHEQVPELAFVQGDSAFKSLRLRTEVHEDIDQEVLSPGGSTNVQFLCRIRLDEWEGSRHGKDLEATGSLPASSEDFPIAEHPADRLATILFTSGTSRGSKGVMLSHRNLIENAIGKLEAMPQSDMDIRLNFLPFAHAYARTCEFSTWLISGGAMATVPNLNTFWERSLALSPTLVNGVPTFYRQLYERCSTDGKLVKEKVEEAMGRRLRMLACGGAGLPMGIARAFRARGWAIHQGYGLTETSPVVCSQRWSSPCAAINNGMVEAEADSSDRKYDEASELSWEELDGHVGWPVRGVEVRIDEQRQIWVRGSNVMIGYWRNLSETQHRIVDGWLQTGDVGRWCDNDALQILGRLDEVIVLQNGRKLDPLPLELLIQGDEMIRRAILFGYGREHVVALIVVDPDFWRARWGSDPTASPQMESFLVDRIAARLQNQPRYVVPRRVVWTLEDFRLERGEITAKGTVRRQVVLDRFADELSSLYASPAKLESHLRD